MTRPERRAAGGIWRREWSAATVFVAGAITVLDALVLQRKRSFFGGGFLAEDYVRSAGEAAGFLAGSFLTDAGVAGVLVALGLWSAAGLGLGRAARRVMTLTIGGGPLLVASALTHELHSYLGAAFDLGLMFELAGRRPEEFVAVASDHLMGPAASVLAALGLFALVVWMTQRLRPAATWSPPDRPRLRALLLGWPGGLALAGMVTCIGLRASSATYDNGLRRKPAGQVFGWVAAVATDLDMDGYGLVGRPPDPAPFDARIHPYGVDWPGNGIDEDGVAGDLPADSPPYTERQGPAPRFAARPPVLFFVLESVRADVVGATLDGRPVTPVLDELARRGVSSRHAYSHNGYTVQSRFHLFTGSFSHQRGGTSLIDDFKANGYEVAYFSAQDESFGGGQYDIGFGRADVAYDARLDRDARYSTFATAGSLAVPWSLLSRRIEAFLAQRSGDRPLFLYVNFHDAHFPYHHEGIEPLLSNAALERSRIGPNRRDDLWRTYANTVANVDRSIGRVVADVAASVGTEPGIVVTSDHGESLYDEGFLGHGYALNEVQTRIPLVVVNLPMWIREPFGQADLRDALTDALSRPEAQGRPVLAPSPGKAVFQYLGTINRPRQLAFVFLAGRVIADLRDSKYLREASDGWGNLVQADLGVLHLIHHWERLVLAQATAGAN